MTETAGALAWRAAKLWVVVRAVVAALTAGSRTLDITLGHGGAGGRPPAADFFALHTPGVLFVTAAVAVLTLVQVDRSGEGVMLANLGLGLRHVVVIAAATAGALEVVVHLAVG